MVSCRASAGPDSRRITTLMRMHIVRSVGALAVVLFLAGPAAPARRQATADISRLLSSHQFNLATDGRHILAAGARGAAFVLVGGLHPDNETPALVQMLLAAAAGSGPVLVLTELSPGRPIVSSVRCRATPKCGFEARTSRLRSSRPSFAKPLHGPKHRASQEMAALVQDGYRRELAPRLLALARELPEGAGNVGDIGTSRRRAAAGDTCLRSPLQAG